MTIYFDILLWFGRRASISNHRANSMKPFSKVFISRTSRRGDAAARAAAWLGELAAAPWRPPQSPAS